MHTRIVMTSDLASFDALASTKPDIRDAAWEALASKPPIERIALRCPSGKRQGWSAFAVAARSAITGRWSRERMDRILRGLSPSDLNTRTADDIPDGAWVWLGGMREVVKNPSRAQRIRGELQGFVRQWGSDNLWAGIIRLMEQRDSLDKPARAALDLAWRQAWEDRWSEASPRKNRTPEWLDEWKRCNRRGWKPGGCPSQRLSELIEYHPDWCRANLDVLRLAMLRGRRAKMGNSIMTTKVFVRQRAMVRHWFEVHRHPDRLVRPDIVSAWAQANSLVGDDLRRMQAEREAQWLDKTLPGSGQAPARRIRL